MAAVLTWYKNNTMKVSVTDLNDSAGAGVSGATVTATLKNAAGTTLWTGTLDAGAAAGDYSKTVVAANAAVTVGQRLTLTINATIGGVANAYNEVEPVTVEERGADD